MPKKRTDPEFTKRVGQNIARILKLRGMTQLQLTQKAGMSSGMSSRLIHGIRGPTLEIAVKIARILECKVEDFYNE